MIELNDLAEWYGTIGYVTAINDGGKSYDIGPYKNIAARDIKLCANCSGWSIGDKALVHRNPDIEIAITKFKKISVYENDLICAVSEQNETHLIAKLSRVVLKTKGEDILADAAETFANHHKIYGENYKRMGRAMIELFPNPVTLATASDYNRFYILGQIITKLGRYAANFDKGGHQDSIHDACVYCAILESLDK